MKILFSIICILSLSFLFAQDPLAPTNGLKESRLGKYVLTHASVYDKNGVLLENIQIVIENDKIISFGKSLIKPKDAIEIDCSGKIILPAFFELLSSTGVPAPESAPYSPRPQLDSRKENTFYWNEAVHPEFQAGQVYKTKDKENKKLNEMGYGFAITHLNDGIAQGTGALVSLGHDNFSNLILSANSAAFFSLKKGVTKQSYPSSQMGSIALVKQLFFDLDWYKNSKNAKVNLSLDALKAQSDLPFIFITEDKFELLRVAKVSNEINQKFIIAGSGHEYSYMEEIKKLSSPIIIPLNFPKSYEISDPYVARHISLGDLKEWEMAPFNAGILHKNGISFAFTSNGCDDSKIFWSNLRKAIKCGLPEAEALKALSSVPASIAKHEKFLGSIQEGMLASFVIYDKNPLREEAKILENWSLGVRQIESRPIVIDVRGNYNMLLGNIQYPLIIEGTLQSPKAYVRSVKQIKNEKTGLNKADTTKIPVQLKIVNDDVSMQFFLKDEFNNGSVNLHAKYKEKFGLFEGDGTLPNGDWIKWSAIKNEKFREKKSDVQKEDSIRTMPKSWYPNMAYGRDSLNPNQTIVIRNATLWTNEAEGIIKDGTIILKNGKIDYVGNGSFVTPNGALVIDAAGKYVTSGIIDEHSHIAISKGVNEGGQTNSAEVSIADVINPDDINIYRQLAGGVTAAQLLHGSANAIGGQSALIKLKWGYAPEQMLIKDAPKFIKFALGENVKQSNWGDHNTVRFPQTRMGVEQVYTDAFDRALAYQNNRTKNAKSTRRDLEMDVLVEILEGKRFITCHSYIQSEINMLMHVADSFGFKINTFTHILEGYKVADKMAAHGAAGSTFSDWWAYKYEVNDAIPYNAKIMHDQGVLVAINSDDAEMGRRLNQEAAKTIKYGGMEEMEAWKLVTLNPAKMLHLDDRMGSLKVGKDADVVIWSANPLSIQALVEYTIVDGQILYSQESYQQALTRNQQEKARIITLMLKENQNGAKTQDFKKKQESFFHCDTLGEEGSTGENAH